MKLHLTLAALCLGVTFACEGPRARIMSDSDQDYVGEQQAGAATFDRLISDTVGKVLSDASAARGGLGKLRIVVLGVENASVEELGDWQEQIYGLITTSIDQAERFDMISKRFVDAALRETRLRPEQLFLPANQRQLIAVLETQGLPVDAILFPKLTSGTTHGGFGRTQRNYLLELELVDVKTGQTQKNAARVRKEYRR